MTVALLAVVGAFGSVLRHAVGRRGTIVVNVVGSFALGLVVAFVDPGTLRVVLATGLCGSFTTFSAFAVEARPKTAFLHVGACLAAAAFGLALG